MPGLSFWSVGYALLGYKLALDCTASKWSGLFACTLVLPDRLLNIGLVLLANLLDLIFSINLLSQLLVGLHKLSKFTSKLLILHSNYLDVILQTINFDLKSIVILSNICL